LVDEFGSDHFKVLAFPCNQFGYQEPGTHEEILDFVETEFKAKDKFTWFEKGHVNGGSTREVFSFLKRELPSKSDSSSDIEWNFAKFLVDKRGIPYKRYSSKTSPLKFKSDIELLLKQDKATE